MRSKRLDALLQARGQPAGDEVGVLEEDHLAGASGFGDGLLGEAKTLSTSHGDCRKERGRLAVGANEQRR